MIELEPRLPIVDQSATYPQRLTARLTDILRTHARQLSPVTNYGWKDMVASVSEAKVPGASAPTMSAFGPSGNRQEYRFAINDYVWIKPFHVNHDVRPQGSGYIHVHWTTNGTQTRTAKWSLEIMRALGHGQAAFAAPVTVTVEQAASGTAWQHMIAEVGDADKLTLTEPDELILVTLKRIANGGTDLTDQVFGLGVDFHYESDRDHTPQKAPDFYT